MQKPAIKIWLVALAVAVLSVNGFFVAQNVMAVYSAPSSPGATDDATLWDITLSSGAVTLVPDFDPVTPILDYTAGVDSTTADITVNASANGALATITINAVPVASGADSGAIALSFGANVITILVTAEDGVTINTYTVTVTRAGSAPVTVTSVNSITDINVAYGTDFGLIGLPATAGVTLSDLTTPSLAVTWNGGAPVYSATTAGTYVFSGTLTMPSGVTNPGSLTAAVNVVVAPDSTPAPVPVPAPIIDVPSGGGGGGIPTYIVFPPIPDPIPDPIPVIIQTPTQTPQATQQTSPEPEPVVLVQNIAAEPLPAPKKIATAPKLKVVPIVKATPKEITPKNPPEIATVESSIPATIATASLLDSGLGKFLTRNLLLLLLIILAIILVVGWATKKFWFKKK